MDGAPLRRLPFRNSASGGREAADTHPAVLLVSRNGSGEGIATTSRAWRSWNTASLAARSSVL